MLAHCMYLMKQYHRAAHLIRSRGLEKVKFCFTIRARIARPLLTFVRCVDITPQTDVMCHYLTVRSLLEAKEYNEALQVIKESEICTNVSQSGASFADRTHMLEDASKNVIEYRQHFVITFKHCSSSMTFYEFAGILR